MTKKPKVAVQAEITPAQMDNSLASVAQGVTGIPNFGYTGAQLSQTDTMYLNNRFYLISNNRQLLSELYVEHGIVQTLVDQPVDDAFRAGFDIKSGQLSADDIEQIMVFAEETRIFETLKQALKWQRLFGGGAVVILTPDGVANPLNLETLVDNKMIDFRDADLWELYGTQMNLQTPNSYGDGREFSEYYTYYGKRIHRSRVLKLEGKAAPSFVRPRLRGWGMSEVERLVRSLNQYFKNQDVVFELLDEAKVDVYKMKGFNTSLMTAEGSEFVAKRIQHANTIKNFLNALTMDKEDEYEQKQMSFSGLSEVLVQIRQGIASDLKMPLTKLFGISAAGFNSGEDDIENYNSMIEGEVRAKCKQHVVTLLKICCYKVLGFCPDDLQIKFKPLRVLSAKDEEEVKNSQFNRTVSAYTSGLIEDIEAKEAFNQGSLLPVEIDAQKPASPPVEGDYTVSETGKVA